jgi:hypothetical protein
MGRARVSTVPIALPAIGGPASIVRSDFRWLRRDGDRCDANEIVAWCNVRDASGTPPGGAFPEEFRDLHVAIAACVPGRVTYDASSARGGHFDYLPWLARWRAGESIGGLDVDPGVVANGSAVRAMMLAGRRVVEAAEDRSALLSGWHDRQRAWWGDGGGAPSTLLGIGICEQAGLFRGDTHPFHDWFAATRGPAHVVYVPDHVLVPAAAVLVEQVRRSDAEAKAIRDDFAQSFAKTDPTPTDWMLAGALIGALLRSPLTDPWTVLDDRGAKRGKGADAVLLSLNAEQLWQWRHKKLGYALAIHVYRVQEATPALRSWLLRDFEVQRRTVDDAGRDYDALMPVLRAQGVRAILALNQMSTSPREDIVSYASFDAPLAGQVGSVRAKDLNLMLHDVARRHDVAIVDNDAIAADLGTAVHLPDGVHGSRALHAELRAETLRLLRARGIDGFAPAGA